MPTPLTNVIEALSWRMATEVCRRDPAIAIREMHPGGGQYDCLTLVHDEFGPLVHMNRTGSIHIFRRVDGRPPADAWAAWNAPFSTDVSILVDELSDRLGQRVPVPLPPTSPRVLAYRIISAALGATAFARNKWEARSGFLDTSGDCGGPVTWFRSVPEVASQLTGLSETAEYEMAVRFWFLLRDGSPVACLSEDGTGWPLKAPPVDLRSTYAAKKKVWQLAQALVGGSLD
jgi:hypothetical protein